MDNLLQEHKEPKEHRVSKVFKGTQELKEM